MIWLCCATMANEDHALLALLRARAQEVEQASLALRAAERRSEESGSALDVARQALETARAERDRVLVDESTSTRPLRASDLADRHAWRAHADAGIASLERTHEERARAAEVARLELEARRRALLDARADELALARRIEALAQSAERARERIEEDDALEAHGARGRFGPGAKIS